jgi:hypothetical protein
MKWYKHISDSLDDPFIFDLINQFGSDGYLVFFGVLEIYSREFKTEDNWKLSVTQSYLTTKLHKRQSTLVIKILKHIQNSGKWEIIFNDNQVIIFIPKFTELLDDWSQRKLRSNFVDTPKILTVNKIKDKRVKIKEYSLEFESFYSIYPNKKDKPEAYKAWNKKNGSRPSIEDILLSIKKQIEWREKANGEFRPEWKNPATWLNKGSWTDELSQKDKSSW